jgi:acylpyruvate hydrolase
MRIARISKNGTVGIAIQQGGETRAVFGNAALNDVDALVANGKLADAAAQVAKGDVVDMATVDYLPPLVRPPKIICLGLNYRDHAEESGLGIPDVPVLFGRFASSLIGHNAPIILPKVSSDLDYEAEMVAVVGKGGKNIAERDALDHIMGYSIFNDASIRDYQLRTPQWTAGKNFDNTGAFGPWLVTADEVPAGGASLKIECRLNGQVMQSSNTSNLIFDVAKTVHLLSTFMTLEAGDVLVMGTPGGVGLARKPPVWMKEGDICEVEIEGLGTLSNPIVAE